MGDVAFNVNSNDPAALKCRVFIGSLASEKLTREEVLDVFVKYGKVTGCRLFKGFGFVQYTNLQDAKAAIQGEHGREYKGKIIDVKLASEGRKRSDTVDEKSSAFVDLDIEEQGRDFISRSRDHASSREGRRSFDKSRDRDREPARNHERDRERDRDRANGRPHDRDRDRDRGYERERERDRDRDRDRDRYRERERGSRDSRSSREKRSRSPSLRERERERDRSREQRYDDPYRADPFGGPPQGPFAVDPYGAPGPYGPRPGPPAFFGPPGPFGPPHPYGPGPPRGPPYGDPYHYHGGPRPPRPPQPSHMEEYDDKHSPSTSKRPDLGVSRPIDCFILLESRELSMYAEQIDRRLSQLGLASDVTRIDKLPVPHMLDDLTKRGALYAIVLTTQHERHKSLTLNILHGTPQEHRNMPIDDAMALISKNFDKWIADQKETRKALRHEQDMKAAEGGGGGGSGVDQLSIQQILGLLCDGRQVTVGEVNRVLEFLEEKRERMIRAEGGTVPARYQPKGPDTSKPSMAALFEEVAKNKDESLLQQQKQLQDRILNLLSKSSKSDDVGGSEGGRLDQKSFSNNSGAVPAQRFQNALDNLIKSGPELLQSLSGAPPTPAMTQHPAMTYLSPSQQQGQQQANSRPFNPHMSQGQGPQPLMQQPLMQQPQPASNVFKPQANENMMSMRYGDNGDDDDDNVVEMEDVAMEQYGQERKQVMPGGPNQPGLMGPNQPGLMGPNPQAAGMRLQLAGGNGGGMAPRGPPMPPRPPGMGLPMGLGGPRGQAWAWGDQSGQA